MFEFAVKHGDVLEFPSDLLLVKHAQEFYGADAAVASRLISARTCTETELRPAPGDSVVIDTQGTLASKRVLFLGTPPLYSFDYEAMEVFACKAIEKIATSNLQVRHITTTVHGGGYGLDGGEALQRLVRGFMKGLKKYKLEDIERITFLTLQKREERMLRAALDAIASEFPGSETANLDSSLPGILLTTAATDSTMISSVSSSLAKTSDTPIDRKRRVFVALPFAEEFQNVYEFGVYPAVRNCGLICERVDETHFTGDILARIRGGIEAADLVIADLTEGRPNVYLEVGYAWGRGVPVIFIAKKGEKLHFDVSTHRCIFYGKFSQFARELEQLIQGIEAAGLDSRS
jgi:hypothetical protein